MRTGNNLEQVSVVLSSRFFVKSFFTKLCVLSCSQFSVFFTKIIFAIFNKIHLYLILIKSKNRCFAKIVCRFKWEQGTTWNRSQLFSVLGFLWKYFVRSVFSVVLGSRFFVKSFFIKFCVLSCSPFSLFSRNKIPTFKTTAHAQLCPNPLKTRR